MKEKVKRVVRTIGDNSSPIFLLHMSINENPPGVVINFFHYVIHYTINKNQFSGVQITHPSKKHILSLGTCHQGIKTNYCRYNTLQLFCCIGVVKVGTCELVASVT